MRKFKYIGFLVILAFIPNGCSTTGNPNNQVFVPQPGQGQYVRPAYLDPELPPRIPQDDLCQSRIYQSLVGQFEGSLYFQAIPGRQRIIKEATLEEIERDDEFLTDLETPPPFIEVREFIAGQPIYAGSIRTTPAQLALEPEVEDRLTIMINFEGIVEDVSCG